MTIAHHPQRPTARRLVRAALRRDPQDRWAAAFGRIAGYSFAVAVVTGIPLLPFFRPSMATGVYHGSYRLLDGTTMSQAYQSVLAISFDVRGGRWRSSSPGSSPTRSPTGGATRNGAAGKPGGS